MKQSQMDVYVLLGQVAAAYGRENAFHLSLVPKSPSSELAKCGQCWE
jgi:hypothetical protein